MSISVVRTARGWMSRVGALALASAAVVSVSGAADLRLLSVDWFREKIDAIQTTLEEGRWDLYATGYAWHLPWGYRESTRTRLNETTWGGGLGRSWRTPDGDRHSVFVLGFADSHRDPQYIVSYGWERSWIARRDWGVGWGYQVFLFSRADVAKHAPLPAVLPCAVLRLGRWEAVGSFVPRVSRDIKGDVLFFFLRAPL